MIEQRGPGGMQSGDPGPHLIIDLMRMIAVKHDYGRPGQALEPAQEAGIHALGQYDGHPRMQPQASQLRHAAQRLAERLQALIGQGKRIAAGEDDLLDGRVGAQRRERLLPARGAAGHVVGELAPKTIAAVHRAGAGCDQQRPPVVLLQQTRGAPHGAPGRMLGERIAEESGLLERFSRRRQNLQQQRIVWISAPHAAHEAARYAQAEGYGRGRGGRQRRIEAEQPQQFLRIGDRLGELLLPCGLAPGAGQLAGRGRCRYHTRPFLRAVIVRSDRWEEKWPAIRPTSSNRACAS